MKYVEGSVGKSDANATTSSNSFHAPIMVNDRPTHCSIKLPKLIILFFNDNKLR